jgi:Fe-S-cluster-containing dehydrogenase component
MSRKGLLIEYEYCTGCQSCTVACKQEHDYPAGKWGIRLEEIITEGGKLRVDFLPVPTKYCDLCVKRVSDGGQPACVKACQAACMFSGDLQEMAELMEEKPNSVLFNTRYSAR